MERYGKLLKVDGWMGREEVRKDIAEAFEETRGGKRVKRKRREKSDI